MRILSHWTQKLQFVSCCNYFDKLSFKELLRSVSTIIYCGATALKVSSTGYLHMWSPEQLTSSCPWTSIMGPLLSPGEIQFGAQKSPPIRQDHSRFSFSVRRIQNFVKNWRIPTVFPNRWSAIRFRSVANVKFQHEIWGIHRKKIILLFSDL
jgi:hypothetical protein